MFIWPIESSLEIVGCSEEFEDCVVELLVPYVDKRVKKIFRVDGITFVLSFSKVSGVSLKTETDCALQHCPTYCLLGSGYILPHVFSVILLTAFRGILSLQMRKLIVYQR